MIIDPAASQHSIGCPFEEEFKDVLANLKSNLTRASDAMNATIFSDRSRYN